MSDNQEPYFPYVEWEILSNLEVTKIDEQENLPKGNKKINITRSEDYQLKAFLHFKDNLDFTNKINSEGQPGSFFKTFQITGFDKFERSCTLEHAYIPNIEMLDTENGHQSKATVVFGGLRLKARNNGKLTHLIEWCLNGPRDYVFTSRTDRKMLSHFTRERYESKGSIFDSVNLDHNTSIFGWDCIKVKTPDLEFIIGQVPKGLGPNWSLNVGIEYRDNWGGIPEASQREEIVEICSFILGRQLLPVGYSMFDEKENIVEAYARSPWGNSVKSVCSMPDDPPIKIDLPRQIKTDDVLSQLLPKYLELCEPLRLKEALWNYWFSRQMPLGTNLPILAAGLESIINGWFRTNKSTSKGLFLSKTDFNDLLKEDLQKLEIKLKNVNNGDKVFRKIERSNEIGIMERYRVFFDDIKLNVNEKEWKAINGRHIFVHGEALLDKTDWTEIAQSKETFETLFNKILLKLLDYQGTFVDRSTVGWPNTQIT